MVLREFLQILKAIRATFAQRDTFRRAVFAHNQKTKWTSHEQSLHSTDTDMKRDGTTTLLNWGLAVVVILLVVFGFQYFSKTREVRQLQTQLVLYQNKQTVLNNLLAECLEYSKRNSAIDPILEANNLKPKSAAAAPAKPATK